MHTRFLEGCTDMTEPWLPLKGRNRDREYRAEQVYFIPLMSQYFTLNVYYFQIE